MPIENTPPGKLIGIARLAAGSELLEAKRQVEYFELPTRQFINRSSGTRMRFVWTINPYRGCEFGCKYCYARYAHEFMELRKPLDFERKIYAKQFSAAAFRAELKKVKTGQQVWIGTATDPYQPAERRYRITRRMLEIFAGQRGFNLGVTTKSDLVRRDVDLFASAARRNAIRVNLTITTLDSDLARLIEPLAPRPALRLQAVSCLAATGIQVHVLANPVMPLINDSEAGLDALCGAAAEAGARSFSAAPLFLKPCAAQVFLPFLESNFPHLARRYRERYNSSAYLKGHYPEMLRERVLAITERHGMPRGQAPDAPAEYQAQFTLF